MNDTVYARRRNFPAKHCVSVTLSCVAPLVEYVRCVSTAKYKYFEGAIPLRLVELIVSARLAADDAIWDTYQSGEDEILELF